MNNFKYFVNNRWFLHPRVSTFIVEILSVCFTLFAGVDPGFWLGVAEVTII